MARNTQNAILLSNYSEPGCLAAPEVVSVVSVEWQ